MTEEQLQAIRARAKKATDLVPWDFVGNIVFEGGGVMMGANIAECENDDIAEFIAHAREDVPALLAEVKRLRAQNEELIRISLWSARRLPTRYYQRYAYQWIAEETDTDVEEFMAEV